MKILLDTNFLVYAAKRKLDYLREISEMSIEGTKIIVLSSTVSELERLVKKTKKLKDKASSELALKILKNYIKKNKIKIKETKKLPDLAMVEIAEKEEDVVVATADKSLKRELKGKARILSIRGKKNLELT